MTQLSLVIPQIGQPDTTEDVKIQNAFTTIQNVINGNLDTNNIAAAAAIKGSQLAASAGITGSQLAASAGITGSQLAASAGITLAQLAGNAWTNVTPATNFINSGGMARLIGDLVFLKGLVQNNTGGNVGGVGSPILTLPSFAFPTAIRYTSCALPNSNSSTMLQISTNGQVAIGNGAIANGSFLSLDGVVFAL